MDQKNKKLILLLGIFISLVFFYLAIKGNTIESIPVDADFGLLAVVSPFWFLAFFSSIALVLFSLFNFEKRYAFLITLFLLVFVIYALPIFVESNPRSVDTFWHFNSAIEILSENSINFEFTDSGQSIITSVANHRIHYLIYNPGSFIILAFILETIGFQGLDLILFMKFFSLASIFLIALLSYLFFTKLLGENKFAYFASFFLFLGNVYIQNHISPQTFGLIFMLGTLVCFLNKNKLVRLLGLTLAAMTILIHLPSALFLFLFLFFNIIFCYLFEIKNKLIDNIYLVGLGIIYFVYSLVFVPTILNKVLEILSSYLLFLIPILAVILILIFLFKKRILDISDKRTILAGLFLALIAFFVFIFFGSLEEMNLARLVRFFVLIGLSFAAVFLGYKLLRNKKVNADFLIAMNFLLIAFTFFVFQFFLTSFFGLEDRAFMLLYFGLALIFAIAIRDLKLNIKYFLVLIIILLAANCLTMYYHENHFFISESNLDGWAHVYEVTDSQDGIFGGIDYYSMYSYYDYNSLTEDRYVDRYNLYDYPNKDLLFEYYILNDFEEFAHILYADNNAYPYLQPNLEANNYNLIYSNLNFLVYTSDNSG
ncbi:hypothetical protein HOE07_05730 [archaeon]|nr:hypothetical protein [archaeon]